MSKKQPVNVALISKLDKQIQRAHKHKQFRPTAMVILEREADHQVLVVQSKHDRNEWCYPQGGVEEGESVLEAIGREIHEELGLGPDDFQLTHYLGSRELPYEAGRADKRGFVQGKHYLCFVAKCLNPEAVVANPEELAGFEWSPTWYLSVKFAETRLAKRKLLLEFSLAYVQ